MINLLKKLFRRNALPKGDLDVGPRVFDGEITRRRIHIDAERRPMHVALLGKSGSGKSSLLRHFTAQDVAAGRGFVYFDVHGDATPFLLRTIAAREKQLRRHLSDKLVVIEPADPVVSVGLNPLEQESPDFVRIAEIAEVLRVRWHLDYLGARTDELLRNALFALSANSLTLIELAPFLTQDGFRARCLSQVENQEVRQYFELRYDQLNEGMRVTMREPILNKISAFTADPRFRHIVGQQKSTFSIREAMDQGFWVIVNLDKGRLGEQALSLGSLIFTVVKNALFTRQKRSLFTVYCDEIQNLVASGSDIETVLSEARKFGVGIVSANQFFDQYPAEMRAAILAVGTHVFFQLSIVDAVHAAQALDGGKSLAERLKNLPQRHCIVKSGSERCLEVEVPVVRSADIQYIDLFNRSRYTRGRVRAHIDRDIAKRQKAFERSNDHVLQEYE
jgi:DNA helicase HerA-like ATPase